MRGRRSRRSGQGRAYNDRRPSGTGGAGRTGGSDRASALTSAVTSRGRRHHEAHLLRHRHAAGRPPRLLRLPTGHQPHHRRPGRRGHPVRQRPRLGHAVPAVPLRSVLGPVRDPQRLHQPRRPVDRPVPRGTRPTVPDLAGPQRLDERRCGPRACGPPPSAPSPSGTPPTTSRPDSTSASTSGPGASRRPTRCRRWPGTGWPATATGRTGSSTSTSGTPTPRTGRRPGVRGPLR